MAPDESDRLSADDARILGLESASITGHTLKLVVLEPGAGALDLEALRSAVVRRLPSQPRATHRVDTSGPEPRWVPAGDFDIREHVRRRVDARCTSTTDLWRIVSALMSEHLDRSRPLWTFDVIGPLADGREAIAARIHHAMADGIAGVRFLNSVLFGPRQEAASASEKSPGQHDSTVLTPLEEARRMPAALMRELGHPDDYSPFDRPVTIARELAFAVAPLAEFKAIGGSRPAAATVNDVLLAVITGGLRRWLGAAGARNLRAQIPVSLHHRDEAAGDLANRDSFLNIDLPLADSDPLRRLDKISAETRERKRLDDADEMYDLFHALGCIKRVGAVAQRLAGSAHEFSLSISNVPGPRDPVQVTGRRVQNLFSSSEPAAHHALRISAISCAGDIGIGLCTDPTALPDIAALAGCVEAAYDELRGAAGI
ncbi:WS/DGAT domain-containing protein [Mycobacterium sp. CVI_P3]|uniref:diacylglycerol O-acyltransferase n=1 Tax=Mycobacterium pinniadriaticum TaxID=2994102 RepID=A0ABT3S915_9MYCO|nr:wax ester/triacylglycerol synthase domain-containing protein [Mycobacterium pinniadriaticum]MCX2929438.1 WS/DGAT domain-containing protein [Mycobacterium pinniadriaticum]MCX2935862.1 WS/DGAT domain-containing protein [Mycobacterium pinniadriaticum]